MIAASLGMGAAVFYGAEVMSELQNREAFGEIIGVALLVGGGLALYAGLSLAFGAATKEDLRRILKRNAT